MCALFYLQLFWMIFKTKLFSTLMFENPNLNNHTHAAIWPQEWNRANISFQNGFCEKGRQKGEIQNTSFTSNTSQGSLPFRSVRLLLQCMLPHWISSETKWNCNPVLYVNMGDVNSQHKVELTTKVFINHFMATCSLFHSKLIKTTSRWH